MTPDQTSDFDAYTDLIDQAATYDADAAEALAQYNVAIELARRLRAEAKVIADRLGLVC